MFCFKVHQAGGEKLLSVCDEELSSQELENFYGKEKCDKKFVLDAFKTCSSLNALGDNIVQFLIDADVVDKENVLKLHGVMHAIVIKV